MKMKMCSFLRCSTGNEVVEDVEVTFTRRCTRNSVPFEVVVEGFDTGEAAAFVELEFGVFSIAGCIRIK
jgi:hypothetical protein